MRSVGSCEKTFTCIAMNTPKLDENRDDSVICLDSSVEMGEIEDDIEDVFSESDFIVNKTLPAGVAPDGFIILDESDDTVSKSKESETQSQSEPLSVNESEVTPIFTVTFRDETVARYDFFSPFYYTIQPQLSYTLLRPVLASSN